MLNSDSCRDNRTVYGEELSGYFCARIYSRGHRAAMHKTNRWLAGQLASEGFLIKPIRQGMIKTGRSYIVGKKRDIWM